MKLHNTLTRLVEDFIPLDNKSVRVYTCGPTVYNHIHIGNLKSFIMADTLRRTLVNQGNVVTHVMNLTDVDDKTITRSRIEFDDQPPKQALKSLAEKYTDIFLADMEQIGNNTKDIKIVKATEHINQMQKLINDLLREEVAYIADDGIYFSIDKYQKRNKKYGKLTDVSVDSTSNARIDNDEYDKDSAHDFALWKKQKGSEPAWDFEVDGQNIKGRPGWHIECSAMSTTELDQPFDIHTGGVDLIFPHHENEIAQSTALSKDDVYAKYFVHNEHLLVDGKKMSKSAGNYYTLEDLKKNGYDPLAFRILILQSHYRSQTNFTWESMEAAQNRLHGYNLMADLGMQARVDEIDEAVTSTQIKTATEKIDDALADDMDTPQALAVLSEIESAVNGANAVFADKSSIKDFHGFVGYIDSIMGLRLAQRKDITETQKLRIKHREEARRDENWALADRLRDELLDEMIGLNDTSTGTLWFRL